MPAAAAGVAGPTRREPHQRLFRVRRTVSRVRAPEADVDEIRLVFLDPELREVFARAARS